MLARLVPTRSLSSLGEAMPLSAATSSKVQFMFGPGVRLATPMETGIHGRPVRPMLHFHADRLGDLVGVRRHASRQQHREFLAAIARRAVA